MDNFSSVSNRGDPFAKLAADCKWKQSQQNTASDLDRRIRCRNIETDLLNRISIISESRPRAYSGGYLEWFAWIDLFRSLVHDTAKSPGEKLALLHRYVKGDCLNVIHGLGGGEGAYIEALIRLKQSCGRRDVI